MLSTLLAHLQSYTRVLDKQDSDDPAKGCRRSKGMDPVTVTPARRYTPRGL